MLRRSLRNTLIATLLIALAVWLFSILVLPRLPASLGNRIIIGGAALIAVAGLFGALSEAEQLFTKLRWPRSKPASMKNSETKGSTASRSSQIDNWQILFADNDHDFRQVYAAKLQREGYSIKQVGDPQAATEVFETGGIDLAIMDIRLVDDYDERDESGIVLARQMSRLIPVVMLTGYSNDEYVRQALKPQADRGPTAVDYVKKEEGVTRLASAIRESPDLHYRSTMSAPPYPESSEITMTLSCAGGHRIHIKIHGRVDLEDTSKKRLRLSSNTLSEEQILSQEWRAHSQQVGRELFDSLLAQHHEVNDPYRKALGEVKGVANRLHLRFTSAREFLSVPVECCFDDKVGEPYLALRHPLSRSVAGTEPTRAPISPRALNDLRAHNFELRVLLIASDTIPSVPDVDEEISIIASFLKKEFQEKGLRTRVDQLHTADATRDVVKGLLNTGGYHIVHYAGHSGFDLSSPEESRLLFWEKPDRQGQVLPLPISELAMCLQDTDIRFMYLSSCESARTGDSTALLQNDFLGITDGIIRAGVPAVLGYRWPVAGESAKALAETFYHALARTGQLDSALLEARRQIAGINRKDTTWLSPILVMQSSS